MLKWSSWEFERFDCDFTSPSKDVMLISTRLTFCEQFFF